MGLLAAGHSPSQGSNYTVRSSQRARIQISEWARMYLQSVSWLRADYHIIMCNQPDCVQKIWLWEVQTSTVSSPRHREAKVKLTAGRQGRGHVTSCSQHRPVERCPQSSGRCKSGGSGGGSGRCSDLSLQAATRPRSASSRGSEHSELALFGSGSLGVPRVPQRGHPTVASSASEWRARRMPSFGHTFPFMYFVMGRELSWKIVAALRHGGT